MSGQNPSSNEKRAKNSDQTGISESWSASWSRSLQRLRAEVNEDVYASWFAGLELEDVAGDTAYCSVSTRFLKSWIQSHFYDKLLRCVGAEFADVRRIALTIRSSTRPQSPRQDVAAERVGHTHREVSPVEQALKSLSAETSARRSGTDNAHATAGGRPFEADGLSGSPLDRKLTFDTFLVGASNQLAHAAALRVAESHAGEPLHYNPLYFHASVGLGKTHLLQAIAHRAGALNRRIIYLTAEKFMYGFVSALKAQTAIAFKERLRAIDILIIDDLQFLQGKSMQQEFCHTLNALIDAGRQVVIASDRPPADLESFDDRVRSRLAGGLCIEIKSFDEALRIKVVDARVQAARAAHPGFDVPAPVVAYVANAIQTNGRDLDGAVNRLVAHVMLSGARLTIETAENAIRDLVRAKEPKRVKIEDILKLVANHYNVSRPDILSSRRTATVVRPRQIAMYLAKVLTLRSLPEIGRRFGGRDHTTVLHAVRKIEALSRSDHSLSEELELLKRRLTEQ